MNLDVKAPGIGDKFMENLWNATAVGANGAHTGLPWYTFPNITTCNKDVFKRSGLDENTVPATMKDMFDMARKVAEAGNGDYGLYGNANWYLAPQWAALGVKFMNDDKSEFVFAQNPLALDWVTNMAELYKMGAIPKDSLTGEPDANKAYFEGDLAIGTPNPSFLRAVKRNNPNVYASTGVGKFPRNEGVTPAIGGQYIAVSAATKNAPLAMKFAEFLTSDQQELAWARDGGAIIFPPAKKALEELLTNPPKFVDDEIFSAAYKVAAESLEENRSEPALLYIQGSIQQELVNNINAGVRGEVSPQEALDKAQDAMNRLLKQLNNYLFWGCAGRAPRAPRVLEGQISWPQPFASRGVGGSPMP
ncbi:hypothetical protein BSZ39_00640 [Bowdeniella nasicola]|uniref:ABC transporter substrate-binding protein n=1 Tax=Bowdeniella nasicola TaxID=208480 RepID=A0A1Q5Q5H7_9ACTO|nr:hypothetical protein BSZ39_00640 [Bowdeniella nasicola]